MPSIFKAERFDEEWGRDKSDIMTDMDELESTSQEKIHKELKDKEEGECQKKTIKSCGKLKDGKKFRLGNPRKLTVRRRL